MRDALELLWLDPRAMPRVGRKPDWQRLLDEARPRRKPVDAQPLLPNQKASDEDRADVTEIFVRGQESDGAGVRAALAAGTRADGRFAPPLLLVGGEIAVAFDELETLKGLAANALPFAAEDEALKAAIAAAVEYLRLPGLIPTPLSVEALARRIRDAFARAPRGVPADFLDAQTQRGLLEQRRYQRRSFHGAPHLRMLLQMRDGAPILVFAPEEMAASLPLLARFPVRLVVEAHPFADQYDAQPFVLAILALARRIDAGEGAAS
jgi:hypothetical protein